MACPICSLLQTFPVLISGTQIPALLKAIESRSLTNLAPLSTSTQLTQRVKEYWENDGTDDYGRRPRRMSDGPRRLEIELDPDVEKSLVDLDESSIDEIEHDNREHFGKEHVQEG